MASKNVQFKFDFNTKDVEIASDRVLTLREQIKLLQAQIQKTPTGTKEFEILSSKLNDTKDKFAQVSTKSREFFDTLSLIPGPIGNIAGELDNSLGLLKTFSSFSAKDIKAQFVGLVSDVKGIAKGLADATGITKLFTLNKVFNDLSNNFLLKKNKINLSGLNLRHYCKNF